MGCRHQGNTAMREEPYDIVDVEPGGVTVSTRRVPAEPMSEHAPQPDADAAFEVIMQKIGHTESWSVGRRVFREVWNAALAHEAERRREDEDVCGKEGCFAKRRHHVGGQSFRVVQHPFVGPRLAQSEEVL